MAKRRILYLVIAIAAVLLVYQSQPSDVPPPRPKALNQSDIVDQFRNLDPAYVPATAAAGNWESRSVQFPAEFAGRSGDAFYVLIANLEADQQYTLFFSIRSVPDDPAVPALVYELRDSWLNTPLLESLDYIIYDYAQEEYLS